MKTNDLSSLITAAVVTVGLATNASAQTSERPDSTGVQDIIVTAQKRGENIQDVPITISAATGESLAASGVRTTDDLAVSIPGLSIKRQATAALVYIRGVGTAGGAPGQEGAVATFIDGVYMTSPSNLSALNNIERVEVLKGPQGTLFGRNATGGAINIITLAPSFEPAVRGSIGYGNKDTVEGNLYVTTGLSKTVAADLSAYYRKQSKGFGRNVFTGNDIFKGEDLALRGKLLFEASENTRFTLSGDYSQYKGDEGVLQGAIASSSLVNGQQGRTDGFYDLNTNFDPFFRSKSGGGSLTTTYEFGDTTLTSITAYRKLWVRNVPDVDATPVVFLHADLHERTRQFSQELQLAGESGRLKWILGVYYLKGRTGYDPFFVTGACCGPEPVVMQNSFMTTESIAGFAQGTYALTDRTNVTVGARLTSDDRSYHAEVYSGSTPVAPPDAFDASKTFSKPTWRLAIDHEIDDDILAFASYNRGFKSGVYGTSTPGEAAIDPEILDAYEVGLKTTLFDRRLRFNSAAYYYKYKNIQLITQRGPSQLLLNAASGEIYGVDVDFDAAITDNFSLRGGATYSHARYTEFPEAPTATPNPLPPFGNLIVGAPADGNHMVFAPDWTANVAADLRVPTSFGDVAFNLAYVYTDDVYFTPDETLRQKGYSLVNGQVTWSTADERFNVRLWGRNLFDKKYLMAAYSQSIGNVGVAAPGRTYGVSLGFNF